MPVPAAEQISLDQVIDSIKAIWRAKGILPPTGEKDDAIDPLLRFVYLVGWGVGFDEGMIEGEADSVDTPDVDDAAS